MIPLSYWYLGKERGGNVGQAGKVGEEGITRRKGEELGCRTIAGYAERQIPGEMGVGEYSGRWNVSGSVVIEKARFASVGVT